MFVLAQITIGGHLLTFALTALVALASAAVAYRLYEHDTVAEQLLSAMLVAVALIQAPIVLLGWTDRLAPRPLAMLSAALALIALVGALSGRPTRVRALGRALGRWGRAPWLAFRKALAERSFVTVALMLVTLVLLYTAWLSWLAPSASWDGLWYHEPMVGFAIQNRGFETVPLPVGHSWINGYPRAAENLSLWFTIFSDRRLIELAPTLMAPMTLLSFYLLAARFSSWRVGAMGLAVGLVLVPAFVLQLRSTYVDSITAGAYLAATHYVTRQRLRAQDLWLAGLALGFLGGCKASGFFFCIAFGGFLIMRVLLHDKRRNSNLLAHLGIAFALMAALMAPTYLRNHLMHDNPVWPLQIDFGPFHWVGPHDLQNSQRPLSEFLSRTFGPAPSGRDFPDIRFGAYGFVLPFLFPVVVYALFEMLVAWFRRLRGEVGGQGSQARRTGLRVAIIGFGLLTLATSPAYWWVRYSLPAVAAMLLLLHAFLETGGPRHLEHALITILIVANTAALWRADPGWGVTLDDANTLVSMSPERRARFEVNDMMLPNAALVARSELTPGSTLGFARAYSFVGNLWDERFRHRVVYLPHESLGQFMTSLQDVQMVVVRQPSRELLAVQCMYTFRPYGSTVHRDIVYVLRDVSAREGARNGSPCRFPRDDGSCWTAPVWCPASASAW